MRDIRSWQMRAAGVERKLQQTKVAYALALQKRALAQADVEEAVDSKRSLCHQLLLLMSMTEDEKYNTMRLAVTGPANGNGSAAATTTTTTSSGGTATPRKSGSASGARTTAAAAGPASPTPSDPNGQVLSIPIPRPALIAIHIGTGLVQGVADGWGKTLSLFGQPQQQPAGPTPPPPPP